MMLAPRAGVALRRGEGYPSLTKVVSVLAGDPMTEPPDPNRTPRPEESRDSEIPKAFGIGVGLFFPAVIVLAIALVVIVVFVLM